MGKQGPCRHCGVTSTPLWRNGPPDKPVLCNACGSRWRTKGSLVNYTPMHAREDIDVEEPRVSKLKPPTSKLMEQKQLKKKPSHSIMENEPFSDQNFRKMGDADQSNRTSSGSAVSYSESCAPYGTADASEMTGSSQSHAWESLVPSRKRSCVTRPKPSPVEKLVKDLNSIMHEEQLHYLSGSSEEDLLYHSETPVGSFEIGYGSVLLRHPSSKSVEEESEASSIPADNKSYITSESYSGSVSFVVHSESMGASNLYAATEKPKRSQGHIQDDARRDKFHYEKQHILENVDSPLVSVDLKDVINYNSFVNCLTNEEQQQLIKFLPPIDLLKPPESLRSMFMSTQFADAMHSYQKLLGEGVLDPSLSVGEKWKLVRRLALTNLTKCKWLECYEEIKGKDTNGTGGKEKSSISKGLNKSTMKPLKRSHETQLESYTELKGTMSPKRICKSGALAQSKCSFLPKSGNPTKDVAATGGFNLFMLPPDKLSMLAPLQYVDNESDQDLLLDVPLNARHAEAELLCQPSQLSSVTRSSASEGGVADGEGPTTHPNPRFTAAMVDPRLFPSGSNASDDREPGRRQYNPYQDLNIPYNYKTLYDLPTSPEFLFQEESAAQRRSWGENLTYYTGIGYLSGAVGGAVLGLRDATASAEPGEPAKIRANRVLNACGSSGRRVGNTLGVIGLMYAGMESAMVAARDHDDWINNVVAGLGTGALFRAANGPRSAAVAGAIGGVLAGAAMAGKQFAKRYVPAI